MRTEDQIKAQYDHESETRQTYVDILLPKHSNTRHVYDMIEKQDSRMELLDWVLERGDFQRDKT